MMKILQKRVRLLPKDAVYTGMFDFAKGIFILGMFLSHALSNYYPEPQPPDGVNFSRAIIYTLINLVRMPQIPMLFMVCGYSWRRRTMAKALKTQVSSLLPPYFAVAGIIAMLLVVKKLIVGGNLTAGLEYNVLSFLFGYPGGAAFLGLNMGFVGPVWFIVCYFFSALLLNAILWMDEGWMRWTAVLLLACLGILLKDVTTIWFLQQALICTGFMYVGWEYKKQKFLDKEVPLYLLIAVILMAVGMSYFGYFDIVLHVWKNGLMDGINAVLLGTLALLVYLRANRLHGKIANMFRWFGRRTFTICCADTLSCFVLRTGILAKRLAHNRPLGTLVEFLLHFAFALVAVVLFEAVQRRIAALRKKSAA